MIALSIRAFPLALLPFLTLVSPAAADSYGSFTYTDHGSTITIDSSHPPGKQAMVVPEKINGKPVTAIGQGAFWGNRRIVSITLPSTLQTIGDDAFDICDHLQEITIPNGVTAIGNNCFSRCNRLQKVNLPQTLTYLGKSAFASCRKLETVNIPSSITTLSPGLFSGCGRLRECQLPVGITAIGDRAFSGTGLEKVSIPPTVKTLGISVFSNCLNLRGVEIPEGLTEIPDETFSGCLAMKRIVLPGSLRKIGNSAFSGTSLTDIRLDGVRTIGDSAFTKCLQLVTVRIPKSVKSIGNRAFFGCPRLVGVRFEGKAPSMGKRVFHEAGYDFRIFAEKEAVGFSVPRWLGYHLTVAKEEIAIHGFESPYLQNDTYTRKFGQVPLDGKSKPHIFKLTNAGNRPLTGIRARVKGGNAADFLIVAPLKTRLAPGKSTTVEIIFSPRQRGKRRTTLELLNSDSNEGVFEISLSGIGYEFL